ncbi:MAG: sigma-54-dependent transcriptional regulator [Gammaproteobacteria bacterium]
MVSNTLIVDDEPDIRELLTITLQRMDIPSRAAADLNEARALLKREDFDLCLTDMRLPDGDGLQLVEHIQEFYPELPVAVITAHGSMETAIQALKTGAFDFVTKPVDLENLRNLVSNALKLAAKRSLNSPSIIGESDQIIKLRSTIKKLARSQAPIYISGESGTGKELVARMIHEQGSRSDKSFVPVNCGAIPAELMESEFFGHIKGSFTGANTDKQGLFQVADGGTLFLDEVAELPLAMQVKLLRAIQEKAIRSVGGHKEETVDVRVLSATHKDLTKMVTDGDFRQDLFYRINVIELKVPPLRNRGDDVLLLVDHILDDLASLSDQAVRYSLSTVAEKALQAYDFPGNVRELENILERAMTLCEGDVIELEDLSLPEGQVVESKFLTDEMLLEPYLDSIERTRIIAALEQTRWNKTAAAKVLGISFRALRYRLEKLDLDESQEKVT